VMAARWSRSAATRPGSASARTEFCDGWTDPEIRWTRFWDCRSQVSATSQDGPIRRWASSVRRW
jgi:hypothetical protein